MTNMIEKIAYDLLKNIGYSDKEIKDFREAADHDISCNCDKCKKLIGDFNLI